MQETLRGDVMKFVCFNTKEPKVGVVIQGDTLRRTCKSAYLVCNTEDDHMDYSGISVFPHTEEVEELLNVKFIGEQALEHKELMSIEKVDELLRGCKYES